MRSVAEAIERHHAGAVEVRLARRRETADGVRRLVRTGNHVTYANDDVSVGDLVYYTISPDYCLPDKSVGSVGTRHRYTQENPNVSTYYAVFGVYRATNLFWTIYIKLYENRSGFVYKI